MNSDGRRGVIRLHMFGLVVVGVFVVGVFMVLAIFGVVVRQVFLFQRRMKLGVLLAGFGGVVGGLGRVAGGDLGVMAAQFDIAIGVMRSGFTVVASGVLVMVGR